MRTIMMQTLKANMNWIAGAALAGALLLAAPHQAQAQVSFGIGVSSYGAPAYGYGYGDPYADREIQRERWIEHERREQWEAARAAEWRHEQWEQQQRYYYGHDHDRWRDRDEYWRHDRY